MMWKIHNLSISCMVAAGLALGVCTTAPAATITWDGDGGGDSFWTTAANWSDDLAPSASNDYVVSGAEIRDPGAEQGTPKTYTFAGDNLTITNGGTLRLRKSNSSGQDYVYEEIPNLTLRNSTIRQESAARICRHFLERAVTFLGDNIIHFKGGDFGSHLSLRDGMSGSGSIHVYRTEIGSDGLGPTHQNSTRLILKSGNFGSYSGDWLVESTTAGKMLYMLIQTTDGWGRGNMSLGVSTYLYVNANVSASNSVLSMAGTSTLDMAAGTSNTVAQLWVQTAQIPAGTYTAAQLDAFGQGGVFIGTGLLTVLEGAPKFTFSVRSEHGLPDPGVGVHLLDPGSNFTASVDAIVTNAGIIYECLGWVGSGDVPPTGVSSAVSVTLSTNSAVTWLWQTNSHYLEISVLQGVTADRTSGWYAADSDIVINATPSNVVWWGDTNGCTVSPGNVMTCPASVARHIAVGLSGAPIMWDAEGNNDSWETTLNWDDDFAPDGGRDYVVNAATIQPPGNDDFSTPATYTFGGASLTVTNGSNLQLFKSNGGGTDNVYLNITNLMVRDSRIQIKCARNYNLRLNDNLHLEGDCEIDMISSNYERYFRLLGGMSGSGTVRLHRASKGSARQLHLQKGDFSGYAGDWTVENTADAMAMQVICGTTTGWGTGDMELKQGGKLTFSASVDASDSAIVMTNSATMHIGDDLTNTVRALTLDGKAIPPATYTAATLNVATGTSLFSGDSLANGTLKILSPIRALVLIIR